MICPVCNTEIKKEDKKFFFGNDRPYINVYLHRDCYLSNKDKILEILAKLAKKP